MLRVLAISACLANCVSLSADIVEVGDLNLIQQPGNPSDGLAFLDLSLAVGLTLVDAQNQVTAIYPDARLATSSEFDHLFAASTLRYNDSNVRLSAGFLSGGQIHISSGSNYNASLMNILGLTFTTQTTGAAIWTDPENTANRDLVIFRPLLVEATSISQLPPIGSVSWLFVTSVPDPTAIPEPSTASGLLACAALWMALRRPPARKNSSPECSI